MKTVQFSISTQFNCQKHFHFKLFKQLCVIIRLSVNTVFNVEKTVLFEIIQLSISTRFKCKYGWIVKNVSISSYSVYSIHFSISMLLVLFNPYIGPYQVLRWQWRGTPHSPKLQHCWNLTIRLFSVISRTLVMGGGLTPLQRCCQCILQPQLTGQSTYIWCIHTVVWTRPLLGKNPVLFYQIGLTYIWPITYR